MADVTAGTRRNLFRRRRPLSPFELGSVIVALSIGALVAYPLLQIFLRIFVVDGELDFSALGEVIAYPDLGQVLWDTTTVVLTSMFFALVLGSVFAWLTERTDARLPGLTAVMPMVPLLMPPIAGAVGWMFLLDDRSGYLNTFIRDAAALLGFDMGPTGPFNVFSWMGMVAIYTIYQTPFSYLMISAGLRNSDPSIEEQARVCGSSIVRTLRTVTIPAIRPSLGAALLYMAWFGFALYSVPVVIGTRSGIDVLSVRIVRLLKFSFPPDTAVAVGLSGFLLLAVTTAWYIQKRILASGRHATVGGKGARAATVALGRWKWPARGVLAGYLLAGVILPLGAHILVALSGFWNPGYALSDLDIAAAVDNLVNDRLTRRALWTSIRLALLGATLGITIAALFAHHMKHGTGRVTKLLDGVIKLPAALPSVVIGVGFILAFSGSPFNLNGTFLILLLCYLVLFIPQATVAADAAVSQVGGELPEASRVSGARAGRTFWRINMPIMTPGLVAGWGLLFVWMVGELSASVLLSSSRNLVVGFRFLDVFLNGDFALLASLSITLTALNVSVIATIGFLSRRRKTRLPTRQAIAAEATVSGVGS